MRTHVCVAESRKPWQLQLCEHTCVLQKAGIPGSAQRVRGKTLDVMLCRRFCCWLRNRHVCCRSKELANAAARTHMCVAEAGNCSSSQRLLSKKLMLSFAEFSCCWCEHTRVCCGKQETLAQPSVQQKLDVKFVHSFIDFVIAHMCVAENREPSLSRPALLKKFWLRF